MWEQQQQLYSPQQRHFGNQLNPNSPQFYHQQYHQQQQQFYQQKDYQQIFPPNYYYQQYSPQRQRQPTNKLFIPNNKQNQSIYSPNFQARSFPMIEKNRKISSNQDDQRRLYEKFIKETEQSEEEMTNSKEEKDSSAIFAEDQFPSLSDSKNKKKKRTTSGTSNNTNSPQIAKTTKKIDKEIFKQYQKDSNIIQVWDHNLEEELQKISDLLKKYPYISMDTEFPGIVFQPQGYNYKDKTHAYSYLKANVDNLDIIQLGITLSDKDGNVPEISTFQFNFKFDLNKQAHNRSSIQLLQNAGIDFQFFSLHGIDQKRFGSLFIQSGLVLNDNVKWIGFHSMFDFGYLIKLLVNQSLPSSESQFFAIFHTFFKCVYDIKHFVCNFTDLFDGSLEAISSSFNVARVGVAHQAGSDSLLTCNLFFALLKSYPDLWKSDKPYKGVIHGLNFGVQSSVKLSNNEKAVNY